MPPKPLQTVAYEHLKSMILKDFFIYNKIYSETKVARDIGISRTPLRDAIHKLEQEKYLDIIPSKGFMLHQLSATDIIETFQIRSAIEGYCTLQITKDSSEKKAALLFKKLKELLNKQQQIINTTHQPTQFVEYDNKFHDLIVRYINNGTFNELFSNYYYQIKRLALLSLAHKGRMEETLDEHDAILKAMETGNTKDIYSITMQHMVKPKDINLLDVLNSAVNK